MLRRAASPLSAALDNLRDISNKAYKTANRIQNLIDTLTDGVRHIARTLRNLLHFLVDIGDICNKEMGVPYRKCRQLFEEARLNYLVHSFQILQDYNLTVFSRACVVKPRHPDIGTAVTIGFLLGLSLLLAVCKGFIQRTRRVVCSWFHPKRERERLSHLRSRILEERRWEKKAQRTAFLRASVSRSRNRERIEALLHRIPGGSRLLRVLGLENTSCLSCSNELNPEMALHCDNSMCSAVYCGVCLWRRGERMEQTGASCFTEVQFDT
uniref:Dendritic cell-specific transmembrane protein-like domain-containing protein n=1 Tax=Periophthalmus magnuspinnatus TaxID=409849 RepID=A0A3B3Z604_9GOBI